MTITWLDDETFSVDDTDFRCSFDGSSPEHFCIRKSRRLVEETVRRLNDLRPQRIVEIGIAQGGSAALAMLISRPSMLVAIELANERVRALDDFISRRSLDERVHPYYGVDQADRTRIATIVADSFKGARLDLVVDDASHVLEPTRATFEVLFPLLRPGGLYVIEDWNWHQRFVFSLARKTLEARDREPPADAAVQEFLRANLEHRPLETLVLELVVSRACSNGAVGNVTVGEDTVVVERGPAELEPGAFRVSDAYVDPRGLLPR